MLPAVDEILKKFRERFGRLPTVVQFDEGGEFYNVGVLTLLKDLGIKYFSSKLERKASVVERFNRMLKTRMWKYFDKTGKKQWLDILEDFMDSYNNSEHSSIKMKPADVDDENKNIVFATLYGTGATSFLKPNFRTGDHVRIYKYKSTFAKGFEANFTDEIFMVSKVYCGDPNMYEIKDDEDEPIIGKFYESEMALVK